MDNLILDNYEIVVGLEVHAQLNTKSKAFCADGTSFGQASNTLVSAISLGHPGTLPKLNEQVINFAIRLGLATNCQINPYNEFARKNYFYADLPKSYQITQDKTPICTKGYLTIDNKNGAKKIGITRIHIEEDAGKSIHDQDPFFTLIDLNRAGVALVEIVSEPDIRQAEDAVTYLQEIQQILRYLDICDGNMEEGSMRCDANISIRLKGESKLGQRTEVKNMNSFRHVQKAIEHEAKRQAEILARGEEVKMETRGFDPITGSTFSMRSKEMAQDYRYFPEPDLLPVQITQEQIEDIKKSLPLLPKQLIAYYTENLGLNLYDAKIISAEKDIANYFGELILETKNYKAAANWLMGPIKSYLNEQAISIKAFPVQAKKIADLIALVDNGKISFSAATQTVFLKLIQNPYKSSLDIATEENILQESNHENITLFIQEVLAKYPEKITEYKNGKTNLLGLFMGEVMKLSKGKADPKITQQLIIKFLS